MSHFSSPSERPTPSCSPLRVTRGLATALLVAAGVFAPGFAVLAQGQDALSLVEAVQIARDNSLAAQQNRQQLRVTETERASTIAAVLPSIGLNVAPTYQRLPSASANAFSGGGLGTVVGFPTNGAYVDSTLSASQVIFDAFATRDQLSIIDDNIAIGKLGLIQAEQDTMVQAATAYFDVLKAEGLAQVAEQGVKQANDHLRLGTLRLKAGTGTKADVLQQRAQLANAQGQLTQSRNAVNLARLSLANVLNAPLGDRPLASDTTVPPVAVNMGHDLTAALTRRTEVKSLEAKQHAEETRASLEGRALWPNLQASGRYAQRGLADGQFQAGVAVNWTVFDSFRVRNKMLQALEQARVTKLTIEQTRQKVALEIRQQYQTRTEAQQRIGTAREGLAAAQEAYRLALKRFEVGVATSFEVTDVQNTMIQSSNNYVQAMNDLRVAEVRLARALGYDLAEMLKGKRG